MLRRHRLPPVAGSPEDFRASQARVAQGIQALRTRLEERARLLEQFRRKA